MASDGLTVILSPDQKELLWKYLQNNKHSYTENIYNNLEKEGNNWIADISMQNFCLALLELHRKKELELFERLKHLGKMQDLAFMNILDMYERECNRLIGMFE